MLFPFVCENPGSANPVFATAYHDDEKGKDYINLKEYWDPVIQCDLEILSARNREQEGTYLNLRKMGHRILCTNSKYNIH